MTPVRTASARDKKAISAQRLRTRAELATIGAEAAKRRVRSLKARLKAARKAHKLAKKAAKEARRKAEAASAALEILRLRTARPKRRKPAPPANVAVDSRSERGGDPAEMMAEDGKLHGGVQLAGARQEGPPK